MSGLHSPKENIGRVGMVAALHHIKDEPDGRLVAVAHPVGYVSGLIGTEKPTFAWQVLVLGEPATVHGKHCRQLIVADRCLRPISQLPEGAVDRLKKVQAKKDFDEAVDELKIYLQHQPISPEDFEKKLGLAADQAQLKFALEVVAIDQVLLEVGFWKSNPPDGDALVWKSIYEGQEFQFDACPGMFGDWTFWRASRTARTIFGGDWQVLNTWPRGKVMQVLLEMWEDMFGKAKVPEMLQLGWVYRQHQEDIRRINPGLPFVEVDGEVFRAIRRWIAQRNVPIPDAWGPHPDSQLSMVVSNGMLQMSDEGVTYGCPVRQGWMDDCRASKQELIQIPWSRLRGYAIRLEFSMNAITINGWAITKGNLE
jgi:hypothetical protein